MKKGTPILPPLKVDPLNSVFGESSSGSGFKFIYLVSGGLTYIYKYAHKFHSIWKVFDVRKMEMEKPSDAVLKLEAAAKLLREPAQSALLSGLQTF